MDEATQAIGSSEPGEIDLGEDGRVRIGLGGRTLAQGPVGAVRVVVLHVLGEHGLEVTAAEDEHAVEALSPEGADHALTDRVGPRRPDGGL